MKNQFTNILMHKTFREVGDDSYNSFDWREDDNYIYCINILQSLKKKMSSLQETFQQLETPPTQRELTNNNSSKEVLLEKVFKHYYCKALCIIIAKVTPFINC